MQVLGNKLIFLSFFSGFSCLCYELGEWINDDPDYSHRQTLYGQIMTQYYRYLRNVMYNIGGIYLTEVKEGTPGKRYEAVPKARQKASMAWVLK